MLCNTSRKDKENKNVCESVMNTQTYENVII
jgi:hypothetical protein